MKQLQLLLVVGMVLIISSSAMADWELYTSEWTTEPLADSFLVTVTIANSNPDLQYMVYRDLLLPAEDATRHNFTAEPVAAPAEGESLVLSYTNTDMDPSIEFTTIGRFVIEATWPDSSVASSESVLLTWDDYYRVAKGYLLEDYLIDPCENVGLMECTTVELYYGELEMHVGSPELLEFYGYLISYDGAGQCSLMIQDIIPLGMNTPCEEPVANTIMSWDGLKATFR